MRFLLFWIPILLAITPVYSQRPNNIANNIYQQISLFPQEKVYLFTDRSTYVAGESVWFRAFLTDALAHLYDLPQSRYIYVDLIDPNGGVVKHHQIRPDSSGIFHNRIELEDDMVEGTYLLRAYTLYMRAKPDYLFEKKLFIANPLSSVVSVEPRFTITRDQNVSVSFQFRNLRDSSLLSVETIKFKIGDGAITEYPARRTITFRANPIKEKYVYLSFIHDSKRFQKFIPIPYPTDRAFDVSFFPEGGYLINGTPSKVGFKALGSDGLSEEVTGTIYDSDDQPIASFQTLHAGMGAFSLLSEVGKTYYALCTNRDSVTIRFDLPSVQRNVCTLQLTPQSEQFIIIAHDHRETKDDDLHLIIHLRGVVLYADKMPPNNSIVLRRTDLPPGIIQVLLLDGQMNPLSERLVFNRRQDEIKAELTPDRPNYGRRELVKIALNLKTPEEYDYDANGSFAISVTDNHDLLPDSTMTIASYLLLSSELRGYIEDAAYYMSSNPLAELALDALMLTQGWRRYDIPSVVQGVMEHPDHYIEGGYEFTGVVKEYLLGRPVQNASVWVMAPKVDYIKEVKTDRRGAFYVSGFEFPDSTNYVIFSRSPRRSRRVELFLTPPPIFMPALASIAPHKEKNEEFNAFVAKADQKFVNEFGMRSYEIPEVVVTATKKDEGRSIYSSIIGREAPQWSIDLYPTDIINILKHSDRVTVRSGYAYIAPEMLHSGPALIVWDDVPSPSLTLDQMVGIPIKRVEMLPMPSSLVFGQQGMGGALLITTDWEGEATGMPTPPYMAKVSPLGYKSAVEFYAPKYETDTQRNSSTSDLRTTIYWKPDLQLTKNEEYIEFYTTDIYNTSYSLVLEGISSDGVIIRQTGQIHITK